jgi:hypothetical protein
VGSQQNILWLHIPVDAVVLVAVCNSLQGLPRDLPSQQFRATLRKLLQFCQHCMVTELEYQVQLSFPSKHFQEVYQVRVFEILKDQ